MTEATQAYRAESDPLGRFLDERCLLMPSLHAGSSQLFRAYEKWCQAEREDAGRPPRSRTRLRLAATRAASPTGPCSGVASAWPPTMRGRVGRANASSPARTWSETFKSPHPPPVEIMKHVKAGKVGRGGEAGEGGETLQLDIPHVRVTCARTLPTLPGLPVGAMRPASQAKAAPDRASGTCDDP